MPEKKLKLGERTYGSDEVIDLICRLDLLPVVIRKHAERLFCEEIKPSEEEQIKYQQEFLSSQKIRLPADLNAWLEKNSITERELSTRLFRAQQIDMFKLNKFGVSVESIFLERKSALDMAMYSMIRTKEKAKASEIHLRIDEEEDTFADLASEFSEGQEQQFNGLIGPIELGKINPAIAERLRISNPGQLWPPFEEGGWWVILRLEKLFPAQLNQSMRQRILNEKYDEWIQEQVNIQLKENIELLPGRREIIRKPNFQGHDIEDLDQKKFEETDDQAGGSLSTWLMTRFQKGKR